VLAQALENKDEIFKLNVPEEEEISVIVGSKRVKNSKNSSSSS